MIAVKDEIRTKAARIKEIDERRSLLNGELEELASEREKLSTELVDEMGGLGDGEGVRLDGIGFVKIVSETYPKILDFDALAMWADDQKVQLPNATINAKTFGAWWNEQMREGKPIPPSELVSVYTKSRIRITKGG